MKTTEFCYWLQGYFELSKNGSLTAAQVKTIRNHLNLVFKHDIDPSYEGNQEEMQAIHDGEKPKPPAPVKPDHPLGPHHDIHNTLYRC